MSKLNTIAVRPDRILVKTFRPVALPGFRISQTIFISNNGQLYCVICQKTFHSPLYTHFVVIDSYGDVTEDRFALKIYEKMSRLNIIQYFQKKQIRFATKPIDSDKTKSLTKDFISTDEQLIIQLLKEGQQMTERFFALEKEASKLFKKETWTFADFADFDKQWRRFWTAYDKRLQHLFTFRESVIMNAQTNDLKNERLHTLFNEANELYQLFVDTVPFEDSLITNVNHFIQLHYELGRTKTAHTRRYTAHKSDVNVYYFVKFGFVISLILVLWTLIRFVTGNGGFLIFLAMLVIAMFFFSIRIGNEVGMLRLIEKRLKELRKKRLSSTKTIERLYQRPFRQMQEAPSTTLPMFKFDGALVKVPRWIIGIGGGLIIIGLLFFRLQETHPLVPVGYLFFGILFIIGGILLPRMKLMQRTFILKDHEIQIGKHTYTREDIVQIKLSKRGKQIKVRLRTHPDPIPYRIDSSKGETINSQIKTWCHLHFVNYKI